MDDAVILETLALDANEWRGLQELANALSDFEPLAKRGNLGKVVAERVVKLGLAEKGSMPRYAAIGMAEGYRLTDLGWKVLDRGRFPRSTR
jgi:hypothetical protein